MTLKEHIRKNALLAAPVMVTQAGQILVNVADNVMVGGLGSRNDILYNPELGKLSLGAVSLGNSLFFIIMVVALGFSFAISPLVAEADAKNKIDRGAMIFSHGFILNLIITIFLVIIMFLVMPLMYKMGQPKDVVDLALPYLKITTMSMIPLIVFQSYRQLSEGLSLTFIVTLATIIANLLNIALNYGWIYGNWGFPRLEVEGAAYGTLVSRIVMALGLIIAMYGYGKSRKYLNRVNFRVHNPYITRKLIKLGTPSALQMFFEIGAFASAAFICGMAGKVDLAAHQIALNLASITFMLCTGLGVAATVRVGNQKGLRNFKELKMAGWSAIAMATIFMGVCGVLFITFRYQLPDLYIDNQAVVDLAAKLLVITAFFQLSDGIQLTCLGALRGIQDVNVPMFITLFAYFGIAIPVGYFLTIQQNMGAFGMWIGLGLGLTFSAVLLIFRFYKKSNSLQL